MFAITATTAVLFALLASPEQAGPPATQQRAWLDDQPMEVPEAYAKPGRGGCRIDFGGVFVDNRMRLVPTEAGELRFVVRRRIKLHVPVLAREVTRVYVGDGPECCGDQARTLIREVTSKPFWTGDGELINDVRPFAIPLAPGEYTVSIAIEQYESRDGSPFGWQPGSVDTRQFVVR